MIDLPKLHEIGLDLIKLTILKKFWTIIKPFILFSLCFYFLFHRNWALAILIIIILQFVTYVSTSHDLVHNTLRINKKLNTILLSIVEMLVLRSGHSFRICHLQHHRVFPRRSDIEGAVAHLSLLRTLLEGPIYFFRLYIWAWQNSKKSDQKWLFIEALWFITYLFISIINYNVYPEFLYYFILIYISSWVYPLFTVYIPHVAIAEHPIYQTKLFRGFIISSLFAHHNYHLEHHLYPMIPHQNWKKLSKRLDPYFMKAKIKPIKI